MPSNPIKRQDDVTGDNFQAFNDGASSPRAQGMAICDDTGSYIPQLPTSQAQSIDAGNTQTVTSVEAQPGTPWVGAWTATRDLGIVRQLVVLASTNPSVGGAFTFEYGEDGATALISETRPIGDFSTVRDFDLINAGKYFRVQFEPTAPLAGDSVFITTTNRRQNDGSFVRLANQEIEEANAAMGQIFVYPKAFVAATGKSVNIRATPSGQLLVADFLVEVAKGNVPGHSLIGLSGYNPDVDSGTPETIWHEGTFNPPAASGVLTFSSGSPLDTALGAGARQITVMGLDASSLEVTEVLATNGTTPVVGTQVWSAINEAYVSDAGVNGVNADNITGTVTATTMFQIPIGYNNTALGFITIPAGKTAFALDYNVSQDNQSSSALYAYLCIKNLGEPVRRRKHFGGHSQGGNVVGNFGGTLMIPAQALVRWDASVSAGNNAVSATTNFLLVDN